jgi:phage shock protein E
MEHKLTADEIRNILAGRAFLIDVRTEPEIQQQHCSGAVAWDVQQMIQGRFPKLPKDAPVFVFCRAGNRSVIAQNLLLKEGFSEVHNVGGIGNLPSQLCA